MFKWLENLILKRIIKRLKKELPTIKQSFIDFIIEQKGKHKDELLEFCKKKLKESLEEFIENNLDKEV